MEQEKTSAVDIEGSQYNWWFVCEECRRILFGNEKECPVCKCRLDWSGFEITTR
jgi:rubrerythrin